MNKFVWASAALLVGCAKHTFVLESGGMSGKPDYQRWHSALLWGMVEIDEVDARSACEGRPVAAVHDRQNVLNALATGLTAGIYQASMVRVWCGNASGASLPLDAQPSVIDVVVSADGTVRRVVDPIPGPELRLEAVRAPDGQWLSQAP
jgi:hypothetical protein